MGFFVRDLGVGCGLRECGDSGVAGVLLARQDSDLGVFGEEPLVCSFERRYVAPNITVAVAGRFDWDALVGLV